MSVKVSVFIPTKNRASVLPVMLNSLVEQSYKDFEVVIVDGGSTDSTNQVVDEFAKKLNIKFYIQKGGLIKQENKGLEFAVGEIFIRTDDDAKASVGWLKEIVKTFDSDNKVGGVTGPTITPNMDSRDLFFFQKRLKEGNMFWRLIGKLYYGYVLEGGAMQICKFFISGAFSLGSNYPQATELLEPIEVEIHECCTMACRTELLRRVGGFDEMFEGVGEYGESDISFKIRNLGYKILFNPKAYAYHMTSKSGIFSARANSYGRMMNFLNFYFRYFSPKTLDQKMRFLTYVFLQNSYYFYMFLMTRDIKQLGSIPATFVGITKNILFPKRKR
jgi:glycosyltransferase involved in cell wall biosynthesis